MPFAVGDLEQSKEEDLESLYSQGRTVEADETVLEVFTSNGDIADPMIENEVMTPRGWDHER